MAEEGTEQTLTDGGASSTDPAAGSSFVPGGTGADPTLGGGQAEEFQPDPNLSQAANDRIRGLIDQNKAYAAQVEAAKEFEPWKDVIKLAKAEGFQSFEELKQREDEKAQAVQVQQRIDAAVNAKAVELNGAIQREEITREFAIRQLTDYKRLQELETQVGSTSGRLQQLELSQLQTKYPNMDPDYVRTLASAPGAPSLDRIAKQSHDRETAREQAVLAKYNGTKAQDAAATGQQPLGRNGNAPQAKSLASLVGTPEFEKEWDRIAAQNAANRR